MAKSSKKKISTPSAPCSVIITGINSEALKTAATEALNEIQSKIFNASVLMTGKAATAYNEVSQNIEEGPSAEVVVCPESSISLLPAAIQSLRHKKPTPRSVLLPDFAQGRNKRSLLQLLGNFWSKLLGIVEVNGVESGIVILNKTDIVSRNLFTNADGVLDNSGYKLANWAVLNGMEASSTNLPSTTAKDISHSYSKSVLSSIGSRWKWFVTSPLKEFSLSNLKQGNSSTYRLLFSALCLFSLVLLPMISFDFGTTWDEPEDRKYFTEVISYFQTGGEDTRALDESRKLHDHLVNYGPFVNLTCAFVEEYLSPFDTYETRHLVLSLFALVGLLFTGLLARKIGSWRTGVIALIILLVTPAFLGHSANNQKDLPFLAFYIASIFYIVRFVQELPRVKTKTLVMTGLTMGILFSIRAGGLIVFAYLVLFAGLRYLWAIKQKEVNLGAQFRQYILNGFFVMGLAYFIGVILWPAALQDPFGHPLEALSNFEKFSLVHVYEIFEGARYYMKDYPWYYAPKMMLITLPLFVLIGLAMLVIGFKWQRKHYNAIMLSMVVFTLVFPLGYIIYKESALYNSWRHVLFVLPSVVVLSAVGWDTIMQIKQKIVQLATPVVLIILVGVTGMWVIQNHPYEYMYYNQLAGGVEGAYGNYELDYWCQTPKQAIKWIHENEELPAGKTKIISNNELFSIQYYSDKYQEGGEELREYSRQLEVLNDEIDRLNHYKKEKIITEAEHKSEVDVLVLERNPLKVMVDSLRKASILWSRELNWNKDDWDYAIWTNRTLSPTALRKGYFPPKGTVHEIKVDGVTVCAVVKRENKNIYLANQKLKTRAYAEAEELLEKYIEYDPLEEEAYRTLGYTHLIQGRNEQAIDWCMKSLEICPESYFSHHFIGIAYLQPVQMQKAGINKIANLDSADRHFKSSAKYKPNFSSAYDGQGDVAMARGNTQQALKMYKLALQYGGNNPQFFFKAGNAYLQLNDLNNAGNYFNAAIQANKNFAQAYYGMYQVYLKAGNEAEANKYLQQYQQTMGR
ncbi:MAG: tetratricopeptide repeat protein [Bacteroidetes bacterium]|jgi:tetratricopeptide (TPR) repeat protein|nr:tetratricopeptide repeat protein [Bacteroidota bacterium]